MRRNAGCWSVGCRRDAATELWQQRAIGHACEVPTAAKARRQPRKDAQAHQHTCEGFEDVLQHLQPQGVRNAVGAQRDGEEALLDLRTGGTLVAQSTEPRTAMWQSGRWQTVLPGTSHTVQHHT